MNWIGRIENSFGLFNTPDFTVNDERLLLAVGKSFKSLLGVFRGKKFVDDRCIHVHVGQ